MATSKTLDKTSAPLSTRELIEILHELEGLEIVAVDIVEYSPEYHSPARTTAFTSAIIIEETMEIMAKSARSDDLKLN